MSTLTVTDLLTNRLENPLGYQLESNPRFSWIVTGDSQTGKIRTQVEVSTDEKFKDVIFDSGLCEDIDSICYPLPYEPLAPRTRYFWRVTVKAGNGESFTSNTAWFETSKLDEPWTAQWIAPDFDPSWHPVLFTSFTAEKPVQSARAYICGLGLYEFGLNGSKAGDECLSPGLCAYDKWLPYQTLDLSGSVKTGENLVEISLGNGWYKGRYGLDHKREFHYGEEFACICELVLTYGDGTQQVIATGTESWQARRSAIMDSSIFDGETRDDTFTDTAVYKVKAAGINTALLEARRSPATKIMHRIKPIEIIKTPVGETVLDMGQNMVGWLEFTCKAPKGAEIHLQFGEVLQQGNFYRDNLRTARAEYRYISDGEEKIICQQFTYYGFRYVKLTQWNQAVNLNDFTGLVLYSDMRPAGSIVTGNPKVNKLFKNTLWGQRGNFLDVPTDCPQRDERMGWTGDAQVFFGTAAFNMDVYAFFSKYCYDLMREQQALGGAVPVVVPKHDVKQTGACAWGDAATIIPWSMYVRYGDRGFLERQYPGMKAWVDYICRHDEKTGGTRLWKGDFHYGDWLALDSEDPIGNRFGGTERTYLASCYYRYSSMLVAKAARVLGYDEEAAHYEKLSDEVRAAIQREYVTGTGRLAVTTQTAYVLALYMDIIQEEYREQTAYSLRLKLKEAGCHLRTGFIGTPYLCRVLSENGSNDIAYRLLLQEDFPSWLYEVNMGATTIWERWNSILPDGSISDTGMNSLNHYSYGSIVEWLYRNSAGLHPLEDYPGFRRFRLAPQPHELLGSLDAEYHSPAGTIKSSWKLLETGELELRFSIPFGSTAELVLPNCDNSGPVELGCGEHSFRYFPQKPMRQVFDLDTPISVIYKNPAVAEAFKKELPDMAEMMLFTMMAGERSVNDFIREGFLKPDDNRAASLCAVLQAAGEKK